MLPPYGLIRLKDTGDLLPTAAGGPRGQCGSGGGAGSGQRTAGLSGEALAWRGSTRHVLR